MKKLSLIIPVFVALVVAMPGCENKLGCTDPIALNYDAEVDEEEELAKADAYPELEGVQSVEERPIATSMKEGSNHAAAMELAPSKKKEEMDFDAWAAAEAVAVIPDEVVEEPSEPVDSQLLRVRVLQSMDDPIITADGEIELGAGDILFLDESTANYLVDSGVAENAAL